MKLEAFSEVSNLVRHLEGLEGRKAQIAEARTDGTDSYIIELRKSTAHDVNEGVYYDCVAYMQAHDADAPFTVRELVDLILAQLNSRIEGVKEKLRKLGVNLDEGKGGESYGERKSREAAERRAQNIQSPSREASWAEGAMEAQNS
jgi:hypothetical protein